MLMMIRYVRGAASTLALAENGDGDINLNEFRGCVRNSLGIKADNKEIDILFSKLDEDGGGSLDLAEVKTALKALKDAASTAEGEAEAMRDKATARRAQAAVVVAAAEAAALVEAADVAIIELQNNPTVASRLGAILVAKNYKVSELIAKWDCDGDGSISKDEFRTCVFDLGVPSTPEEVDALFDSYDTDGGGSLDLHELKPTLRKLVEASTKAKANIDAAIKERAALHKEATRQQRELAALRATEAAAAKAAEEEAARAAEEAQAAEEERRRLAREAKEARQAQKAAEKAEYDAKIAAKRAQKDGQSKIAARREAQNEGVEAPKLDAKAMWKAAGLSALLAKRMGGGAAPAPAPAAV